MTPTTSGTRTTVELRKIDTNGVTLSVATTGDGPAVVLLHGFPHTRQVWSHVMRPLAEQFLVIAPDLRGFGDSTRTSHGYDVDTMSADISGMLDALEVRSAAVVAIDAGTPVAVRLALRRPETVRALVVMEAVVGSLPGAEDFLAGGPPWWFGFHAVHGLAEKVLAGHEAEYVGWFLDAGTRGRGIPSEIRDAITAAFSRPGALRAALSYYRALPESAAQISEAFRHARLTMPTLTIGAHPVGDALERQLRSVADNLTGHTIPSCGHIIPLDRPAELLSALVPFLSQHR